MNVTRCTISDKDLSDILKHTGMTDTEIKAILAKDCRCPEKIRTMRKARRSLLDSIHEKQSVLDRLDYMIWCTEHQEKEADYGSDN